MSITTKQGDDGTTRLFSGERVGKQSPRPDAYGDLDELVSVLSLARLACRHAEYVDEILGLQRLLFVAGAEIATTEGRVSRLATRIGAGHVSAIENRMCALEAVTSMPTAFIIPGSSESASRLHHARCVARRCERKVAGLAADHSIDNPHLMVWLNRLSDYLYLLAVNEETSLIPAK